MGIKTCIISGHRIVAEVAGKLNNLAVKCDADKKRSLLSLSKKMETLAEAITQYNDGTLFNKLTVLTCYSKAKESFDDTIRLFSEDINEGCFVRKHYDKMDAILHRINVSLKCKK